MLNVVTKEDFDRLTQQIELLKQENEFYKKEKEAHQNEKQENLKQHAKTSEKDEIEEKKNIEIPLLELSKLKISDPEEKVTVKPSKIQISMISNQNAAN